MKMERFAGLTEFDALQINKRVMLGAAVRETFRTELERPTHKFCTVEDHHLGVVRALRLTSMFDKSPLNKYLLPRVMTENGVKKSTASKHIVEAMDIGLITEKKDSFDKRKSNYFIPDGILSKLAVLAKLEMQIMEVVKCQLAAPTDSNAGRKLIDDLFYFNMLDHQKAVATETPSKRDNS